MNLYPNTTIFFNKIILSLCLFLSLHSEAKAPKIALVLSGGGARGIAQIGVLRAFEEEGLKPDLIIVTSMGAIIGSLYAAGISADTLSTMARAINWDNILTNTAGRKNLFVSKKSEPINYLFELRFNNDLTPIVPNSISHGQSIYSLISPILAAPLYQAQMNFDSLQIPLRIIATDIVAGKKVVFSQGNLPQIVRASCGIPLAFSPISIDTMLLLDGGLSSNLPIETAVKELCDFIIAVDVTSPMWDKDNLSNPIRLVDQLINAKIEKQKNVERRLADVLITPSLGGYVNTDFKPVDSLIALGYKAAQEKLPLIKERLKSLEISKTIPTDDSIKHPIQLSCKNAPFAQMKDSLISFIGIKKDSLLTKKQFRRLVDSNLTQQGFPFYTLSIDETLKGSTHVTIQFSKVRTIAISGNTNTSKRLIIQCSGLRVGLPLTKERIEKALSSLYATELFHTVNIVVEKEATVVISVTEKEFWRARLGLRFDEYHLGEAYLQPAYENLFGAGIAATMHLQYGPLREKYALELQTNRYLSRNWANNITLQNYISRERIRNRDERVDTLPDSTLVNQIYYDELTLLKAGALAKIGTQIGRFTMVDGGLRLERFKVSKSVASAFRDPLGTSFREGVRYLMARFTFDNLDRYPFPRRGQRHTLRIGGATDIIGGTANFINIQANLSNYVPIKKNHTLAQKITFAWADQGLPPVEQIYLGGIIPQEKYQDIRIYNYVPFIGLKTRAISGDIVFLAHGSYRFAITEDISITSVVDWGYAWHNNGSNEQQFQFDKKTARYFFKHAPLGLGLSLSFQTLVGPLKFSWGRIVSGSISEDFDVAANNIFYFSAGHDF